MSQNKSVLITGARNTGLVTARLLATEGMNVHLTCRELEEAQKAASTLQEEFPHVKIYPYALEQGDMDSIHALFEEIRKNTNELHGFVANAAALGLGLDVYNTEPKDFDAVMDVNVKGSFFLCREAGKLMTENGGSIVLLGSVQAKGAVEGRTIYSISKAAIAAMSKCLAYDLAPYGIRVNCLVAGAIRTDRWENISDEIAAARRANYPLGREADMIDIANGVLYLLSDTSKSMTGSELVIDSGVLTPILPYADRKQFKREDYK